MIYIYIKRGVPLAGLEILVKRIIEHARLSGTRILKKQNKKGKFSYKTWISTKTMSELSEQPLLQKLLKVTKNRTKSITIVVRQKMKNYSHIHEIWDTDFSLL